MVAVMVARAAEAGPEAMAAVVMEMGMEMEMEMEMEMAMATGTGTGTVVQIMGMAAVAIMTVPPHQQRKKRRAPVSRRRRRRQRPSRPSRPRLLRKQAQRLKPPSPPRSRLLRLRSQATRSLPQRMPPRRAQMRKNPQLPQPPQDRRKLEDRHPPPYQVRLGRQQHRLPHRRTAPRPVSQIQRPPKAMRRKHHLALHPHMQHPRHRPRLPRCPRAAAAPPTPIPARTQVSLPELSVRASAISSKVVMSCAHSNLYASQSPCFSSPSSASSSTGFEEPHSCNVLLHPSNAVERYPLPDPIVIWRSPTAPRTT